MEQLKEMLVKDILDSVVEVEYLKALTEQLEDYHSEIAEQAEKCTETREVEELQKLHHSVARLSRRNEVTFNLVSSLLVDLDEKINSATKVAYRREEDTNA